jgi:anti-sigma factor RsiW
MSETHHPTPDRLEAFVEGGLQRGDRVVIESHILGCPACRARVEEWRALFTALATLPRFEPSLGFADRVMAGVRVAPRAAWQQWADRAGVLVSRVAPKTNTGWTLAAAMLALPVILGGGAIAWLMSRSSVSLDALWGYTRVTLVEGVQGIGSTALSAVMQTDVAAWVVAQVGAFISTAGVTGIGAIIASAGAATMLSIWVLYRNLFRTPRRESDYALYSF